MFATLSAAEDAAANPAGGCRLTIGQTPWWISPRTHEIPMKGDRGILRLQSNKLFAITSVSMSGCPDHVVCQLAKERGTSLSLPFANVLPLEENIEFHGMTDVECSTCGVDPNPNNVYVTVRVGPPVKGWTVFKVPMMQSEWGEVLFGAKETVTEASIITGPARVKCAVQMSPPRNFNYDLVPREFTKDKPLKTDIEYASGIGCILKAR